MSGGGNAWYVKTADGDVHRMTLDQIDEAFNAGRIDPDTMCLPDGATHWARLGELAGLDEPAPALAPAPPPAGASEPALACAPAPNSLRPIAVDLDDDLEAPVARRSRQGRVVGFVALAAVLGAATVFGVRSGVRHLPAVGSSTMAAAAAVAPPAPPSPPAAPLPAPAPQPPTAPTATTATPTASSDLYALPTPTAGAEDRFTADQKAKLLAADKAREETAKARTKTRSRARHRPPKYEPQGFTTGGNKYDPLNVSF